jgi:hypothetical protein
MFFFSIIQLNSNSTVLEFFCLLLIYEIMQLRVFHLFAFRMIEKIQLIIVYDSQKTPVFALIYKGSYCDLLNKEVLFFHYFNKHRFE